MCDCFLMRHTQFKEGCGKYAGLNAGPVKLFRLHFQSVWKPNVRGGGQVFVDFLRVYYQAVFQSPIAHSLVCCDEREMFESAFRQLKTNYSWVGLSDFI